MMRSRLVIEIGVGGHQQGLDRLSGERRQRRVELAVVAGARDEQRHADRSSRLLDVLQLTCGGREGRIEQRADAAQRRQELVQQADPLGSISLVNSV